MQIVDKDIMDILPYERNPRKNDKAVDGVANSIQEFGFTVPIVLDKNNVIISGHTRYKAAKKLGLRTVPCVIAEDLTDEQVRAFRIADNKVSEVAEWDDALLELELLDILEIDMTKFGLDSLLGKDPAEEEKKENMLRSMEIRAFEHHDYIVFVFDNTMDWLNVVNEFGLKKVNAGYGTTKKVGVGRVIKGAELIKRIGHTDTDIEPRSEFHD